MLNKSYFISLFILFCLPVLLFAQQSNDSRAVRFHQKALQYYQAAAYDEALDETRRALRADPSFIESWLLLGDISNMKSDYSTAMDAYANVIKLNPAFFPPALYILANLQFRQTLYADAIQNYERYLGLGIARPAEHARAEENIQLSRFRLKVMSEPVAFDPINLGEAINTKGYEFVNYISSDGESLYFTRRMTDGPQRDEEFYVAYNINDTSWMQARPLGPPVNTPGDEGALCISPDGQQLFFAACSRPDGYGSCDIYSARWQGDQWSEPQNLGRAVNSSSWDSQPSFSSDGKSLYFVSNRPGGLGSSDIWISTLDEDGIWGSPRNAGAPINTKEAERGPFIHPDGQTLYFSSKGHTGMGEGDIFVSRLGTDGKWSEPGNIGYPVNTSADEVNMVVDHKGRYAYISSAMEGGAGLQDIYRFKLPKAARPLSATYMKGVVFDSLTGKKLAAKFMLSDLETGKVVVHSSSDASNGSFLLSLPANRNYALNVEKPGYLFYSAHFELRGDFSMDKPFLRDIPLQPVEKGAVMVLRNIFFETDSFNLLPESNVELERLLVMLNDNPGLQIEISGHTDNSGGTSYNQQLSEKRAGSVYDYLIWHGINPARLSYRGYGDQYPVATNETTDGKAANRRTEFKVVKVE